MPVPTARTAVLFALGCALALLAVASARLGPLVAAFDGAVVLACLADALRAPGRGSVRAVRSVREPLSAFAGNDVAVELANATGRALALEVADAPPASFDSAGHRRAMRLPPRGRFTLRYTASPRERGVHAFGDLHVRAFGPWRLAARQWRVPLARGVRVYPDLRGLARHEAPATELAGVTKRRGVAEGREFAALRGYVAGDDYRTIDWKATAKRGHPIVREFQPERNQTLWILLDCGRHLAGRLAGGRTKLDYAVDAALALARAAVRRGDSVGAVLFGAEATRVVPPGRGSAQLAPVADALSLARARVEESDYDAAFDALLARQRRRALVVVFTDLADPDTSALLLARLAQLRTRHLPLVAAVADSAIADAAAGTPQTPLDAYARLAAERILAERDAAQAKLQGAGVRVESVSARQLTAAVVAGYLSIKTAGLL